MSKFTLTSLAVLCTLLMACTTQEFSDNNFEDAQLETRSADKISITYTTETQGDTTFLCTYAALSYLDSSTASILFSFADNTTFTGLGSNMEFSVAENFVLRTTIDNTNPYDLSELSIDSCGQALCYDSDDVLVSGIGLQFIIEDEPAGL